MPYLDRHQIFSTKNLHEMQDILMSLTSTDKVDLVGKGGEVDASLCFAQFGDMGMFHVSYGDVRTSIKTTDHDEDTLLLFVVTSGVSNLNHGGAEFAITPDVALVRDIHVPLTAVQDGFESFVIPLSLDTLKQQARALLGEDVPLGDLKFETKQDLTTAGGQQLRRTVHFIAESLNDPLRDGGNTLVDEGLRTLLLNSVLSALPNSYSDLLRDRPRSGGAVPYYVKRARDFINEHAGTAISLERLANYAGCGYRTLQQGFNEVYGISPMNYARFVRLNRVHLDLQAGGALSVREVAAKWGFTHMGAFSRAYRQQFGVLPSHTLRTRG